MSAHEQVEARRRLTRLVHSARIEQGMQIQDLAEKGKVRLSTLRRALNKHDTPISAATQRGIERALDWPDNATDRILADPAYVPQPIIRPLHPRTSTANDVIAFLDRFLAEQPTEHQKLRALLDIRWH
ncbi:hypothetical protein [Actinocrispum sp. NPDC049592]|uniref:hypothetical protein n=1 Tax=Actinocrispum sp. NPDC049592 TaxID=3154835 RepID=UPI0034403B2F